MVLRRREAFVAGVTLATVASAARTANIFRNTGHPPVDGGKHRTRLTVSDDVSDVGVSAGGGSRTGVYSKGVSKSLLPGRQEGGSRHHTTEERIYDLMATFRTGVSGDKSRTDPEVQLHLRYASGGEGHMDVEAVNENSGRRFGSSGSLGVFEDLGDLEEEVKTGGRQHHGQNLRADPATESELLDWGDDNWDTGDAVEKLRKEAEMDAGSIMEMEMRMELESNVDTEMGVDSEKEMLTASEMEMETRMDTKAVTEIDTLTVTEPDMKELIDMEMETEREREMDLLTEMRAEVDSSSYRGWRLMKPVAGSLWYGQDYYSGEEEHEEREEGIERGVWAFPLAGATDNHRLEDRAVAPGSSRPLDWRSWQGKNEEGKGYRLGEFEDLPDEKGEKVMHDDESVHSFVSPFHYEANSLPQWNKQGQEPEKEVAEGLHRGRFQSGHGRSPPLAVSEGPPRARGVGEEAIAVAQREEEKRTRDEFGRQVLRSARPELQFFENFNSAGRVGEREEEEEKKKETRAAAGFLSPSSLSSSTSSLRRWESFAKAVMGAFVGAGEAEEGGVGEGGERGEKGGSYEDPYYYYSPDDFFEASREGRQQEQQQEEEDEEALRVAPIAARCPSATWTFFEAGSVCFATSSDLKGEQQEQQQQEQRGGASLGYVYAEDHCASFGGALASLTSEAEKEFAVSRILSPWIPDQVAYVFSPDRSAVDCQAVGAVNGAAMFFGFTGRECREERPFICEVSASTERHHLDAWETGHEAAATVDFDEAARYDGLTKSYRRRLDSSSAGRQYQVIVVASTGATSTDWNDASYKLEVGQRVPGQEQLSGFVVGRGTIAENDVSPIETTYNLERGCYVIYTTSGSRPYDVVWEVKVEGVLHQDVQGGGLDKHVFGIGGAMCDMSTCYKECYEESDDYSTDDCSSFGDLLAPPTESAGANCTCTDEEELELRLTCLERGYCDERSQCYLVGDAAAEISVATTLRIESYITIETNSVSTSGMESAMAQWLELNPDYVTLDLVNGVPPFETTAASGVRRLREEEREEEQDQEAMLRRGLESNIFKRLEFLIIGSSNNDFVDAITTIANGVRSFNAVLASQPEESGVQTAEAYTAKYVINEERVPAADEPSESIASYTDSTGTVVDEEGEVVVQATEAPEETEDFTRSAQFLIGAGLVVVVTFFLSIIACIVCHMKRKERREFKRKNKPVDGRAKPIHYVDPWGSVANTFQKQAARSENGHSTKAGSQTAHSSTSA